MSDNTIDASAMVSGVLSGMGKGKKLSKPAAKASKSEKSVGKLLRPRRVAKQETPAKPSKPVKEKVVAKSAKPAKSEKPAKGRDKKTAKPVKGKSTASSFTVDSVVSGEAIARPSKFNGADFGSVSEHFLYLSAKELGKQVNAKAVAGAISASIKEAFGVSPNKAEVATLCASLVPQLKGQYKRKLSTAMSALKAGVKSEGAVTKETLEDMLDEVFGQD